MAHKAERPSLVEDELVSASARALLLEEVVLGADRKGVVILEPGSYNLRFGFAEAEDRRPASIVNCVAYRCDQALAEWCPSSPSPMSFNDGPLKHRQSSGEGVMELDTVLPSSTSTGDSTEEWELGLAQLEFDYSHMIAELARVSKNSSVRFINKDNCAEAVEESKDLPTEWANISTLPESIVGDQALYLDDDDGYDVYFPIQHGRFNFEHSHMTDSREQRFPITMMQVLDSLERIWRYVTFDRLEIAKANISRYDVLLVIPDSFDPCEVQHMIDILLLKIGFGHVLLQKSSACAALGAGRTDTCVVNFGFSTTTVCCVDEMEVVPGSSFSTLIGGIDVSRFLKAQLTKHAEAQFFKYTDSNIDSSIQDLIIFEEMKESCCHLNPSLVQPKMYEFMVRHRHSLHSRLFRTSIGAAQFFAPMILCFPNLDRHRLVKYHNAALRASKHASQPSLPSSHDMWADAFQRLPQASVLPSHVSSRANGSRMKALGHVEQKQGTTLGTPSLEHTLREAQNVEPSEEELLAMLAGTPLKFTIPDELTKHDAVDLSLAHLIVASISSATSNQRQQARFYSQILIIGGSSRFPNLPQLIETELQGLVPSNSQASISIISPPAGVDPTDCVWAGASLLVSHAPREYWLDRVTWRTHGLLALREKLLFCWDNPLNLK